MKRALLSVAVAIIAITSCGGSGKRVVGTYCRIYYSNEQYRWLPVGGVWLVFSDGSTSRLEEGDAGDGVACFAGDDGAP